MYHVIVYLAFGTGGWKHDPHRYYAGVGVAMCRSPKRAIEIAELRALRQCGDGSCWIPIYKEVACRKV